MLAYADNTSESLAGLLRTGKAGSNTTADHLTVVDAAIAAVPAKHRRKLLITCDGAGASHGLVDHLHALNQRPGHRVWYTIGWELGERERQAITDLPEQAWQVAIDTAGDVRTSHDDDGTEVEAAHVAEITGPLRSNGELDTWPADMRIIVRRELPHPGAQLSLFEQADGYRYQLFATNIPTRPAEPGMANAFLANLSYLDAANRSHARVEDRIRTGKDTGLDRFPSHRYSLNTAWMSAALLAATLLAWFRNLALGQPPGHRHRPHPSPPRRTLTPKPIVPTSARKETSKQGVQLEPPATGSTAGQTAHPLTTKSRSTQRWVASPAEHITAMKIEARGNAG